jgi:pantetheine-phosphate adenylyltransferase
MKKIAVFPGSFDPFTKGHENIVRRGIGLFDEIIVGIGVNSTKVRYFSAELMVVSIGHTFRDLPNVSVEVFKGLTAEFAKQKGAQFLLRGVRNTTDFEYENTVAQANAHLFPGLETFFLITNPALASINSTIVRDLHKYNAEVNSFLPYNLEEMKALQSQALHSLF